MLEASLFASATLGFLVVMALPLLILVIQLGFFYEICKKAEHEKPWLVFTVVLAFIPILHVLNKSAWNVIWFLIPSILFISSFMSLLFTGGLMLSLGFYLAMLVSSIIALVLSIMYTLRFLDVFGLSRWFIIVLFIPYVNIVAQLVLLGYVAFSKNVQYKGTLYTRK
ncbi:hypothetical protein [Bacillus bombysepticus]|uniref:hypothetical protein n=1 Tax=Bacillus bombysepticus TaxID=658666 RepID=UPI00301AFD0F